MAPTSAPRPFVPRVCTVCNSLFHTPLVSPAFDSHLLGHEIEAEVGPPTED